MPQKNFYHGRQANIVTGSAHFAASLLTDFASLGISNAQATGFGIFNTSLQGAWSVSNNPETRTSVSIEATRTAIVRMRDAAKPLAQQITGNPAVTNAQLMGLGLLPRTSPSPRPAVQTPPEVRVIKVEGRLVTIGIKQAGLETSSRPIGSVGAYIFSHIGTAPTDPNAYKFEGLATKKTAQILFPNEVPSGSTVFIAAAWVSQRNGARGFACTPVSATLQGGPVLAGEGA